MRPSDNFQSGFTLIGVLVLALVIGIAAAGIAPLYSTMVRSEKEHALRYRLNCIRRAIGRYNAHYKKKPSELEELVKGKFLRQLYSDPMTGQPDWEIIQGKGLGIMDIKSSSTLEALGPSPKKKTKEKQGGQADEKNTYNQW